ncbi:MAG TPA: isocitrate/isopropylmalate dehydrogenase family protein, partial [Candidatus Omnitrophica bacterium]|nr:isocitrate/isopropylmalate dehydrogenase family protein [Candidatus Omnitrophota bacterium]
MPYKVTIIPGDGIGKEVSMAARRCVDATGVKISWDEQIAGEEAMIKSGTVLPDQVLASIRKNKVAIKGPITTPVGKGFRSVNVRLRMSLDLYACLRPCRMYEGVKTRYKDVDLIVVRENTEDLYAGIEFAEGEDKTKEAIEYIKKISGFPVRKDSAIGIKP